MSPQRTAPAPGERSGWRTRGTPWILILVLLAGCGAEPAKGPTGPTASESSAPSTATRPPPVSVEWLYPFTSFDDIRAYASMVAIVTVESEAEYAFQPFPEDPGYAESSRVVTLTVERHFYGPVAQGATLRIGDGGWTVENGVRHEKSVPGMPRLRPGDRALVALIGDGKGPSTSGLMHGEAAFILADGEVTDTGTSHEFPRTLQALSEAELIERFDAELEP